MSEAVAPLGNRHAERTAVLGMAVFIASWAMLFSGLFFAYLALRVRAPAWPPPDLPRLPLALPALATLLLGLSSASLQRAVGAIRLGERGRAAIALAALLGAGFLALQTVVWRQMLLGGLRPSSGTYASVFFGLTVFHALHVLVGLIALAWLAARPRLTPVRIWTIYWHMVGVIWGVMFALVYVL
jgi:heme/copper-type cytochrome/quinol oxidase subunit 3